MRSLDMTRWLLFVPVLAFAAAQAFAQDTGNTNLADPSRPVWILDEGPDGGETAQFVVDAAVQIHGANGLTDAYIQLVDCDFVAQYLNLDWAPGDRLIRRRPVRIVQRLRQHLRIVLLQRAGFLLLQARTVTAIPADRAQVRSAPQRREHPVGWVRSISTASTRPRGSIGR